MIKLSQCEAIRAERFLSVELSSNFDWAGCWRQLKISPIEFKGAKRFLTSFLRKSLLSKLNSTILLRPSHKFCADFLSTTLLLWAPKVSTERRDGQVCACTLHPWRFGFEGSTTYVVKIVLLIEHSGGRTGCQCVSLCTEVFFVLFFFSVLLELFVQSKFASSNVATVKWNRNSNRKWKFPTIFLDFSSFIFVP